MPEFFDGGVSWAAVAAEEGALAGTPAGGASPGAGVGAVAAVVETGLFVLLFFVVGELSALFFLAVWLRSHPLWPDQRSAAPAARVPPCYRQQAARARAPRCRFSLGFSFGVISPFAAADPSARLIRIEGVQSVNGIPRARRASCSGGTGASCCDLSEK